MPKYVKYISLAFWAVGIILMVVTLFVVDRWISIPMVLSVLTGSILGYAYTKNPPKETSDVDDTADK